MFTIALGAARVRVLRCVLVGGYVKLYDPDDVLLVFNDGPSELGTELPVGSIPYTLRSRYD